MLECKFLNRKTNEVFFRNYKYKRIDEIEAMASANGWLLVRWKKEL